MADNNSYENKKNELIFHFNQIYKVCENKFTKGWGSYLFNGHSYEYDERMFEKQKLLFNLSKKSKSRIYQNLFLAFVYNTSMIPLAVSGVITPNLAALAMALSSISVVLNSSRKL